MNKNIGKIRDIGGEVSICWGIENFFSLPEVPGLDYFSPPFYLTGSSSWYLRIFPFGDGSNQNSANFIAINLGRKDYGAEKSVLFSIGILSSQGKIEQKREMDLQFAAGTYGFAYPVFYSRAEILERKTELVPHNTLTISCTVQENISRPRADLDTLSATLRNVFRSEENTDFLIRVKNRDFLCHRFILKCRSPVFAAMLEAEMTEKNTGTATIEDCDPDSFQNFLDYLYSGRIAENSLLNIFSLYVIADKYQVTDLKALCVADMSYNISVENACDILQHARQYNEDLLSKEAEKFILSNFKKVIFSDGWTTLNRGNPLLAVEIIQKMVLGGWSTCINPVNM